MAKAAVGIASVEGVYDDKGLETGLRRAGEQINRFSKSAKRDLESIEGGFLDGLAKKAKAIKRENRISGESALGSILGGGVGGLATFGLEAMGAGLVAMVTEQVLNSAGKVLQSLNIGAMDYVSGKSNLRELAIGFLGDVATSNSLSGSGYRAMTNGMDFLSTATGIEGLSSAETNVKQWKTFRDAEFAGDAAVKNAMFDLAAEKEINPYSKQKIMLAKAAQKIQDDFTTAFLDIQYSPNLLPKHKPILQAKLNAVAVMALEENQHRLAEVEEKAGQARHDSIRGGEMSNLGFASRELAMLQSVDGGNSAAAEKLQKQLGVRSQIISMNAGLDKMIRDESLSPEQRKDAATQKSWLAKNTEFLMNSVDLPDASPTRYSSASYVNDRYFGAADFARESSMSSDESLDAQARTAAAVEKIRDLMLGNRSSTTVLPNAGGI